MLTIATAKPDWNALWFNVIDPKAPTRTELACRVLLQLYSDEQPEIEL